MLFCRKAENATRHVHSESHGCNLLLTYYSATTAPCDICPHSHKLWYFTFNSSSYLKSKNSFLTDLSTHLKHLEQGIHVEPPDAKGHIKYSRHDDEHQQQSEPRGEGDAQQRV